MKVSVGPVLVTAIGLSGSNGAGPIIAPGLKVGDRIVIVTLTMGGVPSSQFPGAFVEAVVSIADQIQQLDTSNLSAAMIDAILVRIP